MPQVEYMPGTIVGTTQDIQHTLLHNLPGRQQERRVKVALYTPVIADTRPGRVKINAPIAADNIATCFGHQFQETGCAGAKVNARKTGLFHPPHSPPTSTPPTPLPAS